MDSTPVQQIHPEIKHQRDRIHIDTDDELFLLIQESYPSTYNDYDITNHSEKLAISILNTVIVPKLVRPETKAYNDAIKRISTDYHSILFQSQAVYCILK